MAIHSALSQNAITIDPGYLRTKRIIDILFTLLFLLPLCIVMVIVAVFIRLNSKGPVFFRQRRVGLNGCEFDMFKFRSMYVNCDDSIHLKAVRQYMNGAALNEDVGTDNSYKLANDPRVTRLVASLEKPVSMRYLNSSMSCEVR